MTTAGIEGLYIETHNWGKRSLWQGLGYVLEFETDHNPGQLSHPNGGPYVFVAERPAGRALETYPVLRADDAAPFQAPAPARSTSPSPANIGASSRCTSSTRTAATSACRHRSPMARRAARSRLTRRSPLSRPLQPPARPSRGVASWSGGHARRVIARRLVVGNRRRAATGLRREGLHVRPQRVCVPDVLRVHGLARRHRSRHEHRGTGAGRRGVVRLPLERTGAVARTLRSCAPAPRGCGPRQPTRCLAESLDYALTYMPRDTETVFLEAHVTYWRNASSPEQTVVRSDHRDLAS